jgi:hypothetical protein
MHRMRIVNASNRSGGARADLTIPVRGHTRGGFERRPAPPPKVLKLNSYITSKATEIRAEPTTAGIRLFTAVGCCRNQ